VLAHRNSLNLEGSGGTVIREVARKLGISLIEPSFDAPHQEAEYRRTFAAMAQESADAVIVSAHLENWTNRRLIVELAEKGRLPAIYLWREFVEIGGLMAYAFDLAGLGRGAADAIDQILKGVKAGEIPFSQPTKFVLSINVNTAKVLGLTVPPALLARADEVIE
jgi:putative ABC transport system substrate-binding protein